MFFISISDATYSKQRPCWSAHWLFTQEQRFACSTERCSRSHYSPSKYVTLLTCKLALSALVKTAFNGPQPRASNPDSVLSNSSRSSDSTNRSTLACIPAGEKGWDSLIWLSHPGVSLLLSPPRVHCSLEGPSDSAVSQGSLHFTTCSYPETELTSKIINSYIPRNKTEWYWNKRLFERLMEIFQSRPCFLKVNV